MERDAWTVALVGLGRDLCGSTLTRLAESARISHSGASKLYRLHRRELGFCQEYATRVSELSRRAVKDWTGA